MARFANDLRCAALGLLLSTLACATTDDGDGDDEVGDGDGDTSGDGDGDPTGDGDGEGSGDGDGDGDSFAELCTSGCDRFLTCAPAEFSDLYADLGECESTCAALYGGCVTEATAYFQCFIGLWCEDVVLATTQGPDATACGPSFDAAQTACGL